MGENGSKKHGWMVVVEVLLAKRGNQSRGSFNRPVDAFFLCATRRKCRRGGWRVESTRPSGKSDWTSQALWLSSMRATRSGRRLGQGRRGGWRGIAFSNVCDRSFQLSWVLALAALAQGQAARRDINIELKLHCPHCRFGPLLGQPLPGPSKTNAQTTDLQSQGLALSFLSRRAIIAETPTSQEAAQRPAAACECPSLCPPPPQHSSSPQGVSSAVSIMTDPSELCCLPLSPPPAAVFM